MQRRNRIRYLAHRIAGVTQVQFFRLPRELRERYRNVAREMYDNGMDATTAEKAKQTDKRGFVYVIRNPAWPAHVKVGRAFDPESRLNGFQTGSPQRDYELHYAVYFEDCHRAEELIHDTLADYRAHGEWFRILPSTAEHVLNEIGGYL